MAFRGRTYSNIKRLNMILRVLVRYGFNDWVASLKVFPLFTLINKVFFFRKKQELPAPVRIRLVLEELGPSFIKLGQILSIRADILPFEYVEELKKLQDKVPSFPFETVKKVIQNELKADLKDKFLDFDEIPVASASIAQVHFATLKDGTNVAVKVKRPGIEETIDSDISVMYTIAGLLERYVPAARRYRPKEAVDEFARVIHKEQDFNAEGTNAVRFYNIFKEDPTVYIPRVYWEHTTTQVLTLERIEGVPVDEVDKIRSLGLDAKIIAENALRAFLKQVLYFGFFHADLHPGNIFAGRDGSIIYLDFGITGRVDDTLRRYLARMLYSLVRRDYYEMALIHKEMGLISKDINISEFEDALRIIGEPIFGKPLESIDISALLLRLLKTARRFEMRLQPDLLLLQKSMVIVEGVGRQLYPELNAWEIARPVIYRWMTKERLSPKRAVEKGKGVLSEISEVAVGIPKKVHTFMDKAISSELRLGFEHYRLDEIVKGINNVGNRIFLGLTVFALFLSSSVLIIYGSGVQGFSIRSFFGWAGYIVAVVISFTALFVFFRKRRK